MALTITEFLRTINPNIGLVVNADGSFRIGVEDINSDEILAAIVAGNVDLAALEVINTAIQVAVEASQVDLAALEVINTAIQAATEAVETVSGTQADAIVAAGAVGTISAKLRRATQGLADLLTGIVLAAGTAVIGKVRLVSTDGTEVTDDTASAIKGTIVDATGTDVIGAVTASPAANTLLDRLKALLTGIVLAAGSNVIGKVQDDFGGNVYSKTMTMANDNATRFETSTKKLRDVVILVETFSMLLGETGVEVYTVAANGSIGFTKVDISMLYFKNAGAGSNGKITIIGVEE